MKVRNIIFGILIIISSFYLSYIEIPSLSRESVKIDAVVYDKGSVLEVVFCLRENCSKKLTEFILSAQESVYCAFFDLDLENVKDALNQVDAKLIVDSDNYDLVKDLSIEVKQDYRSAFMHNKFCIIDSSKIVSGSMNPTSNGDLKNTIT